LHQTVKSPPEKAEKSADFSVDAQEINYEDREKSILPSAAAPPFLGGSMIMEGGIGFGLAPRVTCRSLLSTQPEAEFRIGFACPNSTFPLGKD